MRKLLVAVCLVSMVFATTAIAAETYTEKFVQSKTQKIVDAEKKARAQQAENEKKNKISYLKINRRLRIQRVLPKF